MSRSWPFLAGLALPVSRSFYLSLKALPAALREGITLAYLLARASDSIADSSLASPDARREYLQTLQKNTKASHPAPHSNLLEGLTPGEAALFHHWENLQQILGESPDSDLIHTVWQSILMGQLSDIDRLAEKTFRMPISFPDVVTYADRVAGAVGVFWTDISARRIRNFSQIHSEKLRQLGREYGIALQLINILRDREKDEQSGRIYLSEADLPEALARIQKGLDDAHLYVQSLRNIRLIFSTALPVNIAHRLLPPPGKSHSLQKISRHQTRILALRTAIYALCPARTLLFPNSPLA